MNVTGNQTGACQPSMGTRTWACRFARSVASIRGDRYILRILPSTARGAPDRSPRLPMPEGRMKHRTIETVAVVVAAICSLTVTGATGAATGSLLNAVRRDNQRAVRA